MADNEPGEPLGLSMTRDQRLSAVGEQDVVAVPADDARLVVAYLVVPESDSYIAIMDVLESSVDDLTPREVATQLSARGIWLEEGLVEARLDKLREWRAVTARTDNSKVLRHADILSRNWRYTATTAGRHAQRFYRAVLAGTPTVREIPLTSLQRVVATIEALQSASLAGAVLVDHVGSLFVNHDDLDAALVGAEDGLAGLADRFDLDDASAGELKGLLVSYATRVAAELERGSARAFALLTSLRPRFSDLADHAVATSDARSLIERGALHASRGGRVDDWEALLRWFHPMTGRSARFAFRLVRALPGMHVNLRRLHSSAGTATSRARALSLAKACAHPDLGTAILHAALGDHSWRKLHGVADEDDGARAVTWRTGPRVDVPALLRATGRSGARGSAPAPRDDSSARQAVAEARERRARLHAAALREVLAAGPEAPLSERAARVALVALLAAVKASPSRGRRTASRDGLACTLFDREGSSSVAVLAPSWRVLTPGRVPVFHRAGTVASAPPGDEPAASDAPVELRREARG